MSKVINLFEKRQEKEQLNEVKKSSGSDLVNVMEKNQSKKDKLDKERADYNKKILRRYRIKK